MGLFVYTQKGSIISMVDLPTTEIIEPKSTPLFTPNSGSFLPFVKSIKALSKKRDKTVAILRLLSYFYHFLIHKWAC